MTNPIAQNKNAALRRVDLCGLNFGGEKGCIYGGEGGCSLVRGNNLSDAHSGGVEVKVSKGKRQPSDLRRPP